MSDHVTVCDDDGMPFSLTCLLPLVGRGVRITVEFDEEVDRQGETASDNESPMVYQAIGMTPSGYAASRAKMRQKAQHKFVPHMIRYAFSGEPITPRCSRCDLLVDHSIHN